MKMKTYIVAYTLQHSDHASMFKDNWIAFKEEDGRGFKDAEELYQSLIENDGGEEGWSLWTICISEVIKSTDY